uniref:NADH-ubiquinone oxidoreductase chain 3 n=1 Tax=Macrocheles muscaedomesticae TaxID=406086 RepID=A0A6B9WEG3_9ACAR|nr:NADH dehydrogenase subunit 3 [Macrocheles muscaedomesticae]QHQ98528.1 NADH dehydrogenase subunit 3 [Macrocheles muscaedomesticae]
MIFYTIFILTMAYMFMTVLLNNKMNKNKEKASPFECGFEPFCNNRTPFSLRFFKIILIFLIFDIEIILILPIPLKIYSMSHHPILFYNIIILIILMGLFYEWYQGALNWIK